MYMSQMNLNVTPEFQRDLEDYMKRKGIRQKSEAIRLALREALERLNPGRKQASPWDRLFGFGLKFGPLNPKPRFKNDDDLWE